MQDPNSLEVGSNVEIINVETLNLLDLPITQEFRSGETLNVAVNHPSVDKGNHLVDILNASIPSDDNVLDKTYVRVSLFLIYQFQAFLIIN